MKNIKTLTRNELVVAAVAAGIKDAAKTKTVIIQAKLRLIEEARTASKHTGRPINPNSDRQKRLLEAEVAKVQGIERRGRPSNPESPSAIAKAERESRKAAGIDLRGRPKAAAAVAA